MGITILALVAFTVFDSVGQALLPPLVYFACAYLEGGFITPQILGRRLQLNPVSILLSVMLWGWLWGVVGAVLAVPILTVIKVLCDYNPSLAGLGEFLGVDAPPRKHGALVRSWLPSWASKVFRHDNRTTVT
jgi:predicted PurR-regulated permease PerM